jgi:hypothetical protein
VLPRCVGYAPGMAQDRTDDTTDFPAPDLGAQVDTRAEPLPEEAAAGDDGDRHDEAAEILRDSEQRVAEAAAGDAPGDAADENRTSAETAELN